MQMTASPPFHVRKVAILGAGVMGAQIAAHLTNANVPAVLFELAARRAIPMAMYSRPSTA
jgi:3-hydroxyacyl-CoA dehydrogenase